MKNIDKYEINWSIVGIISTILVSGAFLYISSSDKLIFTEFFYHSAIFTILLALFTEIVISRKSYNNYLKSIDELREIMESQSDLPVFLREENLESFSELDDHKKKEVLNELKNFNLETFELVTKYKISYSIIKIKFFLYLTGFILFIIGTLNELIVSFFKVLPVLQNIL